VEWAEVHGHRYGTSHAELDAALAGGAELLLDIDVQGARQVADRFPDAVTVFILPPDFETLERRLRGRGTERPADLARRLSAADSEVRHYRSFRYVVVNGDVARATGELRSILAAERARTTRRGDEAARIVATFPGGAVGEGGTAGDA
jgi:guanylate kinase